MKKILQCGLFTLLASAFVNANALEVPQQKSLGSAHASSVALQSLSQPDEALSVKDITKNVGLIAEAWMKYCSKQQVGSEELQMLNNVFRAIQSFTEEQVLELVNGSIQTASQTLNCYACEPNIIKALTSLMKTVSLLSKLNNGCGSLLTEGSLNEDGQAVLRDVVMAIKCQSYEIFEEAVTPSLDLIYPEQAGCNWNETSLYRLLRLAYSLACSETKDIVLHSIKREYRGDCIMPLLQKEKYHDEYPNDYIGIYAITYKEPHSSGDSQNFQEDSCDTPYKLRKKNSPFNSCEVRFFGSKSYPEDSAIRISGKEALAQMLFDECVVSSLDIDSIDDNFQSFPTLAPGYELEHLSLFDLTVTDSVIRLLQSFGAIGSLVINNVRGNVGRLLDLPNCKVKSVSYAIGDEDPSLLLQILKNEHIILKQLIFGPHFLCAHEESIEEIKAAIEERPVPIHMVGLCLEGIDNPYDTLLKWSPVLESIKIRNKRLIVSSEDLNNVPDIDDFGSLFSKCQVTEYDYVVNSPNLNSTLQLIPYMSQSLTKAAIDYPSIPQAIDAANVVLGKILNFCHDLSRIRSNGQICRTCHSHIMLHPRIVNTDVDELSHIRSELNKYKNDKSFNWFANQSDVTNGNRPGKYILMQKDVVSNSRELRQQYARIMTELLQVNCKAVNLKPLNDKFVKYYTLLSDEQIPQLSKVLNMIREAFEVQPLQAEQMLEACSEFYKWIKGFQSQRETFMDELIAQTNDVIARMIAALEQRLTDNACQTDEAEQARIISLIEELKSKDVKKRFDSVTAAHKKFIKSLRENYLSLMIQTMKCSEDSLQETVDRLQAPDKKKSRKE